MRSWANFHRCNLSASDGEFFLFDSSSDYRLHPLLPVQARLFLQTVDFSQGDFPAVLDVEERGKLSAKELRKRVSQWLKMVEKRTGKKPIIYSGAVFYHTNLAGYFNEYPWWVAHYYQRRPDNDGMAWRFWQHSDRGQVDGINGPVDFNVFRQYFAR